MPNSKTNSKTNSKKDSKTNAANPWLLKDNTGLSFEALARAAYQLVCRKDLLQPGFALIHQMNVQTSLEQRQSMYLLKEALSNIYFEDAGEKLDWFNLNRFDQQNSTKPHRDGAPEESLLILGYEPSTVKSELSMSDYSKLAVDMGIEPNQFLEDYNPMYNEGNALLEAVTTKLTEFNSKYFQLVVVNNSATPFDAVNGRWQGVLHCAKVEKQEGAQRVINSTVVCPAKYQQNQYDERERWFLTSIELQDSTYQ